MAREAQVINSNKSQLWRRASISHVVATMEQSPATNFMGSGVAPDPAAPFLGRKNSFTASNIYRMKTSLSSYERTPEHRQIVFIYRGETSLNYLTTGRPLLCYVFFQELVGKGISRAVGQAVQGEMA